MGQVILDSPMGGIVDRNKPTGAVINIETEGMIYMENKTILKGQPMGLLLTLTYPSQFSFIGERT